MRPLPNIEHPGQRMQRWDDAPEPASWATVPLDTGLHAFRSLKLPEQPDPATMDVNLPLAPGVLHRASPDWIIDVPPRRSRVVLEGLSPHGPLAFRLPALQVLVDYVAGERTGTRELAPQMLLLLPEEQRFCMIYRHVFNVAYEPNTERCMRLRLARGWCGPAEEKAA